ncbi:MAG: tRNA (adenosine(37)-N6)-threonylcarbamoyltransferase complex dimerization subunit type 1 TsaB [Candidatus Omnitrophota bacterium]
MNLLAIETSSPTLSVAIKKRGSKLRHATVQGYMKHAENLLPVIDRLLKKEKLKIGDIDAFLISRGPGSFTGLRIGFATLKGFLATRPKPCYGASSLDVIAAGIKGPRPSNMTLKGHESLTVCVDARRGKLYARSYRYHKKRWAARGPARVVPIHEIASSLSRESRIVGDGLLKIDPRILVTTSNDSGVPRAATLIELFEAKDPLLKELKRPKDFLPAYLRLSEPEEKLKDKKHVYPCL